MFKQIILLYLQNLDETVHLHYIKRWKMESTSQS